MLCHGGLGHYGITLDGMGKLVVSQSGVLVAFHSADLDQHGEDVISALGEAV